MLLFPVDKPLGTVEGMMLCPNLSRPGGTGSRCSQVCNQQIRCSSCSSMYNTLPLRKKIRNLENKQDLEMEMDRTQLHIIEWKWRTSPVLPGVGDIPVLDEDR